jgi:hypothetical protein
VEPVIRPETDPVTCKAARNCPRGCWTAATTPRPAVCRSEERQVAGGGLSRSVWAVRRRRGIGRGADRLSGRTDRAGDLQPLPAHGQLDEGPAKRLAGIPGPPTPASDSVLEVSPGTARLLQGRNPSLAIMDEVHVMEPDAWDALALAGGTRARPLVLGISNECDDGLSRFDGQTY